MNMNFGVYILAMYRRFVTIASRLSCYNSKYVSLIVILSIVRNVLLDYNRPTSYSTVYVFFFKLVLWGKQVWKRM